jgi:hypothetical protein
MLNYHKYKEILKIIIDNLKKIEPLFPPFVKSLNSLSNINTEYL